MFSSRGWELERWPAGDGGQGLEYANPDPPASKKERNLMPFPETLDELRAAGYRFNLDAHCRGCGARIEWWITPAGKHMPMDVTDSGQVKSHFATCPKVEQFRKERA